MPTISTGASATETLSVAQSVSITCDPAEVLLFQVLRAGALVSSGQARNSQVIGPFMAGDVVTMTAQRGPVEYTLAPYTQPAILTPEQIAATQALVSGAGVLALSSRVQDAAANTTAIQAAMNAGGRISILQEGLVPFVPPLIIQSDCWLDLGAKTELLSRPVDPANSFSCIVSKMIQDRQNGLAVPVTFSWSVGSSTPTLNWNAHSLAVGDYVWTQGALPGDFNVVASVISVTNANAVVIQLDDVPESAPTGTITALKADRDIRITGGRINYNAPTNTAGPGWRHYGLVLGGENVYVEDVEGGASVSQFLIFAAARNYGAFKLRIPNTPSGVIQIQGCCTNGRFEQIGAGQTGDDGISVNARRVDGFEDYQLSDGPVKGIMIDGVSIRDRVGTGLVTIYPTDIYKTAGIKVRGVRGSCVGGTAVKVFGYSAGLNVVLEDLEVDDIDATANSAVQFVCTAGCLSLTVRSFKGTRINNNHDILVNSPFRVGPKVRIISGCAEIFQRNAVWPGGAKGFLAQIFGRLDDFQFKFIATNGVDGNVVFLSIAPDVAYTGKITVEESHTKTGLVTECVRVNTSNVFGVLAFKNNVLTTDVLVNWGQGTVPSIDFEFSGNTFTDRGNLLGMLRMLAGPTHNIRSDGTNRLLAGATLVTMPVSAVNARFYGWDLSADPIALPLPAVAGQFFNSTRAGAVNQGPARSNAANFVALGTGAAGANTVIS